MSWSIDFDANHADMPVAGIFAQMPEFTLRLQGDEDTGRRLAAWVQQHMSYRGSIFRSRVQRGIAEHREHAGYLAARDQQIAMHQEREKLQERDKAIVAELDEATAKLATKLSTNDKLTWQGKALDLLLEQRNVINRLKAIAELTPDVAERVQTTQKAAEAAVKLVGEQVSADLRLTLESMLRGLLKECIKSISPQLTAAHAAWQALVLLSSSWTEREESIADLLEAAPIVVDIEDIALPQSPPPVPEPAPVEPQKPPQPFAPPQQAYVVHNKDKELPEPPFLVHPAQFGR